RRVPRRVGGVLVLEVEVELDARGQQRPQPAGPRAERLVVVGRLAEPQVAEGLVAVERVHRLDAGDARPGGVPELEGVAKGRVGRGAEELEPAVVARSRRRQLHEDRPEPLAERVHALAEGADEREVAEVRDPPAHLDREAKGRRRLLRPRAELLLGWQAVEGRVQLDRWQPLRVRTQEPARRRPGGVEARLPRRVGEAGGSDIRPWYARRRG